MSCEFYVAAAHARESALIAEHIRPEQLAASKFHALTRALPLAVDGIADAPRTRRSIPGHLAGVGVLAVVVFLLLLFAGSSFLPRATPTLIAGSLGEPTPSPVPTSHATSTATLTPSSSSPSIEPTLTPAPTPSPTLEPTVEPTSTPEPTVHRYRVRRGDTLQRIANRFGTTVRALMEANGLDDAADIRVGQNLIIP